MCLSTVLNCCSLYYIFSELKRRLKAEKKAKEKAERLQAEAKAQSKKKAEDEEDIDPNVRRYMSCLVSI